MADQDSELVVSYLTLRQMIGWIGLVMPFSVRVGAWLFEGIRTTDSISAYYYTGMRDVFVSTLVLVGILLTCYRTQAVRDTIVAIVAGLAAIGIGLFPMEPTFAPEIVHKYPDIATSCYLNTGIRGYHFIFVTAVLQPVVLPGLLQVRRPDPGQPTTQKVRA